MNNIIGEDLTIVNQILPHKNKWAWQLYLKGIQNNWTPSDIPMQIDIQQWQGDALTEDEKLLTKRCLGFFASGESLVSNNLLLSIFRYVCDGEARQYILRQIYEESLHNFTIVYICDSLNLPIDELYESYINISSIKDKDDFLMSITRGIYDEKFDIKTIEGKQEFLKNIVTYYILCEGIFFYTGFVSLLSLGRRNLLPGVSQQMAYSYRDETLHLEFGINLINKIKEENPNIWTNSFKQEISDYLSSTVELEKRYAEDILPRGILGLNKEQFMRYSNFIGNRRCQQIELPKLFPNSQNPFKWLAEYTDNERLTNFFEGTVKSYKTSGLRDDF